MVDWMEGPEWEVALGDTVEAASLEAWLSIFTSAVDVQVRAAHDDRAWLQPLSHVLPGLQQRWFGQLHAMHGESYGKLAGVFSLIKERLVAASEIAEVPYKVYSDIADALEYVLMSDYKKYAKRAALLRIRPARGSVGAAFDDASQTEFAKLVSGWTAGDVIGDETSVMIGAGMTALQWALLGTVLLTVIMMHHLMTMNTLSEQCELEIRRNATESVQVMHELGRGIAEGWGRVAAKLVAPDGIAGEAAADLAAHTVDRLVDRQFLEGICTGEQIEARDDMRLYTAKYQTLIYGVGMVYQYATAPLLAIGGSVKIVTWCARGAATASRRHKHEKRGRGKSQRRRVRAEPEEEEEEPEGEVKPRRQPRRGVSPRRRG